MPSNQMDINIELGTSQSDVQAIAKLTEALKAAGGTGGGGGSISKQFGTAAEAGSYLREQEAAQRTIGGKLSGASIRAEAGGGVTASAKVDDAQKKAFNPGGAIAAMATGVGVSVGIFKSLLGMSKIFQTFMGTTGKILATAVDLMLAPLMPIFMRIMVWLIQKIFPLATTVGDWLGGLGVAGAGAALVGGYVALKLGPTLLKKAGEGLGKWFVEKMDVDTIGEGISKAFTTAKETLGQWYTTIGEGISKAFTTAKETLGQWYTTIGEGVSKAFTTATETLGQWYTTIGEGVSKAFTTASETLQGWYTSIGEGVSKAVTTASETLQGWYTSIGEGISKAVTGATETLQGWYTSIGEGISKAVTGATETLQGWYTSIGEGVSKAVTGATETLQDWYTTIGEGISKAVTTASETLQDWYTSIGTGISKAFTTASDTLKDWYDTIAKGIGSALTTVTGWASEAGKKIAGAIAGAPAWVKIGGLVAVAIGAVALGAAIGYSMWKTYKEHEAGKDVIGEQTNLQLLDMFTQQYGIDKDSSKALIKEIRADETGAFLGRDRQSMEKFAQNYTDLMRGIDEFGIDDMESLTPILQQFERRTGRFIIKQLRVQEEEELGGRIPKDGPWLPITQAIGSELSRINRMGTGPEGQIIQAAGGTIQYSAIQEAVTEGMGYLGDVSFGAGTQGFNTYMRQLEDKYREGLEKVYPGEDFTDRGRLDKWTLGFLEGDFTRKLTDVEKMVGWALTLAQDVDRAALFVDDPARGEFLTKEFTAGSLARLAPALTIIIEGKVQGLLTPEEMAVLMEVIHAATGPTGAIGPNN